ncbi:ribosome rescue GTPase HflX [Dasania marina]|uniref:ribosome rescue GTPase HflX n=1 Tax=Dasania marina TaxID=471499 RepID=UPI00036B7518|nr:ribosome rescue GTPase HflX [Dasania marina]
MLFERPDSGERAVLVHLDLRREDERENLGEFKELVLSAGGDPVAYVSGRRDAPHSKFFVGTGKLEEIRQHIIDHDAELVLFNHALSPSQERNIEAALSCRVLDRTGLILDIFAQRARTHEGKLQVELAQLHHMSTRLIRGWTHLERQKGGIGLRGPGETQLESDRRLLRGRIKTITKRLAKVRSQRDQGRRSRNRNEIPTIALVGYTNAGKSTLFNKMTDSAVYAADQLFATLDPTLRRLKVPDLGPIVLADTVGFIRHLPHKLVEAFRATLEEAAQADFLVHIIDCADEDRAANIEQVELVLKEIGAHKIPRLEVYNKVDIVTAQPHIDVNDIGEPQRVWLSAQTGEGIELLLQALAKRLSEEQITGTLSLMPSQGRLRATLYELNVVSSEHYSEQGLCELQIRLPKSDFNRIVAAENLNAAELLATQQLKVC